MKKIIILIVLTFTYSAMSQSLSVFDVDASNFPTIKAKFFAFDKDGKQISNLNPADFELKENGLPRTVTNVSCPAPQPPIALSSVLVFDVSGSMVDGPPRILSAKNAANAWIDGLPLGKSECALVSFNENSNIVQDFTSSRDKLKVAINKLTPSGGTNYDQALIDLPAGGLQIAKNGKYKKVVIFLTDGLPNSEPNTAGIIKFANDNQITIYAVTLDMPAPQSIKDMTTQTGGQYFENITTQKEAEDTYRKLLQSAQGGDPCEIVWESKASCIAGITNAEIEMLTNQTIATARYQNPVGSILKMEFNPAFVKFLNPDVGVKVEEKVTVTAVNSDFNVTNITSNNAAFDITPKSFTLNSGESRELTVSYFPADSGYNHCRFDVESQPCPTKFYVSGGWKGKRPTIRTLKLLHPNGGEVFIAGFDTVITWEGISPDEPITIKYSIDNGVNWIPIADKATGLSYTWRIPKTPSNQCLALVTAAAKSIPTSDIEMVLIPAGTFQMGNTGAYSGHSDEKPVHTVTISRDFLMSKTEITQKQYEEVMETEPSYFKGDNLPVETVSWDDAVVFCNKLSDMEGLEQCYKINGTNITCNWDANGYRLPTEAEWEYAAKAGTTTDFYNGSLTNRDCSPIDANLDKIGWYCGNSGDKTNEVGQKEPNAFGLYDMSGNVWEWCWDWFSSYTSGAVTDPIGPSSGSYSVYRGGGWRNSAYRCRSARRPDLIPVTRHNHIGFRVVLPQ